MAKIKSTPNLPASSRMQMPAGGGTISIKGGLKSVGKKTVTNKIMSAAKGKGMASKKMC